jgi:murein L,D-transpeptidase YcbB/YkuD
LAIQRFALFLLFVLFFVSNSYAQSATTMKYAVPLEVALHDYEQLAVKGGWEKFPVGKSIKIGMKDVRIPIVRQILSIMGDYQEKINLSNENLDDALGEAIKKFQIRHGLEPDGAIGKKTQAALAIPVESRIAQIKETLAHLYEIPDLGERYILVNVAGFFLKAVEKNQTIITSKIIVGNSQNHTPLFQSEIVEVIFNPEWHVPARIAREEVIKKQRENPNYLKKSNFMVKTKNGKIININDVDWDNTDGSVYKLVQRAGDGNALGKIKFNVPNVYGVYLHSTSTPKLFAKAQRDFSHGCMRVEMARELAYFVMNGVDGWDKAKIDKFYDGTASKFVEVPHVPVYVTYLTSWVDEDSKQLHFQDDVYGLRVAASGRIK